ncbi:MAG: hypothetical protein KGJ78_00360 [Alphaproteobacteria bacterium]|nr:hypothetical protein [Alphaproteobacteria bacterium]
MHILRSIVVFLIGVGFAAGAYMSGFAQQLPSYLDDIRHLRFTDDGTLSFGLNARRSAHPVVLRVSSYAPMGGPSGCAPVYRVSNETDVPVYFAWSAANDSDQAESDASRETIKVPPGSTMVPSDPRAGFEQIDEHRAAQLQNCRGRVEVIELGDR